MDFLAGASRDLGMAQQPSVSRAREGARKVLTDCLALGEGDVLALFFDETTDPLAVLFREVAEELRIEICPRRVPTDEQAAFNPSEGLRLEDIEALAGARGILTCLSDDISATLYRTEVIRIGTTSDKRLGHMPGANMTVLANAVNIDYRLALSRCDDLALALSIGQTAKLETYRYDAAMVPMEPFRLQMEIGGLLRSPISSIGIIPLGTWGNLPGGETFIAPMEDTANGSFSLNGSFLHTVLKPPAQLLLRFSKGRLEDIEGAGPAKENFLKLLSHASRNCDPYFDSLAELGIGVNSGIPELTGNALFDEKCAGTAHIALGDNMRYGGLHSSSIHEDLVTRSPSLWIDDKPVLDHGEFALVPEHWRESLAQVPVEAARCSWDGIISRSSIQTETTGEGFLKVRREVAAGRICSYTIATPEASRALARVYDLLPLLPDWLRYEELSNRARQELGMGPELLCYLVNVLLKHGVAAVRDFVREGERRE